MGTGNVGTLKSSGEEPIIHFLYPVVHSDLTRISGRKQWICAGECDILLLSKKKRSGTQMLVRADKKWDYALGMIKVDGLEPSPEMKKLIEQEKRGEITTEEVRKALDRKYKMKR